MCLRHYVGRYPQLHLDVNHNSFTCDCRDYGIISLNRFYAFSHLLDFANCDEPSDLYSAKVGITSIDVNNSIA